MDDINKLVIIGGIPRSGTNLVRRIIGSHSQVAIPPGEFQFFNQLSKGLTQKEALSYKRLEKWNIDISSFYNRDPHEAYINILQAYANSVDKPHLGEKTPHNEFWYEDIKAAAVGYDLKFIHMVRNPFDVLASYKHMHAMKKNQNYKTKDISAHMRNWQRSVSIGLARQWKEPEIYRVLRYEALASKPEETTASLCNFIGIEFEKERMLGLATYVNAADNTSFKSQVSQNHSTYKAIKAPVSRKDHLSRHEVQQIGKICGELAKAFGYNDPDFVVLAPERDPVSLLRRIKRRVSSRFPLGIPTEA